MPDLLAPETSPQIRESNSQRTRPSEIPIQTKNASALYYGCIDRVTKQVHQLARSDNR